MKDVSVSEFLQEMSDVKPLPKDNHRYNNKPSTVTEAQLARQKAAEMSLEEDENYLATEYVEFIKPMDLMEYKKPGVQEGVFKKLRLGKYDVDAVLNLHHLSLKQARNALFEFVKDCLKRNIRTVLIQHGTGKDSKPHPAVLKSYVNKWLQQIPEVLAFHTAIKAHGGYGASYLLLRKSDEKKQQNRERHSARK